jgi:hypothetical protein
MGNVHRPTSWERIDDEVPWADYFSLVPRAGRTVLVDKANGQRTVFATFEDAKRCAIEETKLRVVRDLMCS